MAHIRTEIFCWCMHSWRILISLSIAIVHQIVRDVNYLNYFTSTAWCLKLNNPIPKRVAKKEPQIKWHNPPFRNKHSIAFIHLRYVRLKNHRLQSILRWQLTDVMQLSFFYQSKDFDKCFLAHNTKFVEIFQCDFILCDTINDYLAW